MREYGEAWQNYQQAIAIYIEFGDRGANCKHLRSVWLQRAIDQKFQFITLKPYKEKKS